MYDFDVTYLDSRSMKMDLREALLTTETSVFFQTVCKDLLEKYPAPVKKSEKAIDKTKAIGYNI